MSRDVHELTMAQLMEEKNSFVDAIFFEEMHGMAHSNDVAKYMEICTEIDSRVSRANEVAGLEHTQNECGTTPKDMAIEAWNHMLKAAYILSKLEDALPNKDAKIISIVRSKVTSAQDDLAFNVEWE